MGVTRRALLTGGLLGVGGVVGVGALVEYDVLPGRTSAYDTLGLNGEPGVIPDVQGGPVRTGTLRGAAWRLFEPPDPEPGLPVVVALHGAYGSSSSLQSTLGLDRFLAASGHRFVIAGIDGGPSSYWHPRDDGSDTGALVLDSFLPLLGQQGYDVARPAFLGWSMGGYGAMLLATRLVEQGAPVGPVAATSPAVWEHLDDAAPGAFDGPDDFAEAGMFQRRDLLAGVPLRIDCGRGDPFYRSVADFADDLDAEVHFEAGAHDADYWTRVLPAQLDWLAVGLSAAGAQ
ncbi:alpha/beta hydrolase [Nocardioides sp.]|uniref:alpha/beta hydrolase n=1 Tax=Nocardioides sp. TaxID=35761 RepID=UPI003D1281C7